MYSLKRASEPVCVHMHVGVSRYLCAVRTNMFEHVSVCACVNNKMSVYNCMHM